MISFVTLWIISGNIIDRYRYQPGGEESMRRINYLHGGHILCCLLLCGIFHGNANAGDAAGPAVVKPESLIVYPRPAVAGEAVKHLKKGAEVFTDVEITGTDGVAWCNVLREWDMATVGYVQCESLERKMPAKRESWRALPSKDDIPAPAKAKPANAPQSQATQKQPDQGPEAGTPPGPSSPAPQ
jgi:hypothetical protein